VSPQKPAAFCGDEEDPLVIFARSSAGPHAFTGYAQGGSVATAPEGSDEVPLLLGGCCYNPAEQVERCADYIRATYGTRASR
jgi:hypothetical protein